MGPFSAKRRMCWERKLWARCWRSAHREVFAIQEVSSDPSAQSCCRWRLRPRPTRPSSGCPRAPRSSGWMARRVGSRRRPGWLLPRWSLRTPSGGTRAPDRHWCSSPSAEAFVRPAFSWTRSTHRRSLALACGDSSRARTSRSSAGPSGRIGSGSPSFALPAATLAVPRLSSMQQTCSRSLADCWVPRLLHRSRSLAHDFWASPSTRRSSARTGVAVRSPSSRRSTLRSMRRCF
mmetsp:Transcript_103096/g.307952  ORF Transcript_103096/g.307952 Transcript_103096/m.307952 type:complete len:234 (-) Transcript_103096:131-832(-)